MGIQVTRFESTPNPNALKCVIDRTPGQVPRSYFNANQAQGDPLAEALFAIDGVTNLLIHDGWVTVSKHTEAAWGPIKTAVTRTLAEHP